MYFIPGRQSTTCIYLCTYSITRGYNPQHLFFSWYTVHYTHCPPGVHMYILYMYCMCICTYMFCPLGIYSTAFNVLQGDIPYRYCPLWLHEMLKSSPCVALLQYSPPHVLSSMAKNHSVYCSFAIQSTTSTLLSTVATIHSVYCPLVIGPPHALPSMATIHSMYCPLAYIPPHVWSSLATQSIPRCSLGIKSTWLVL
jgi:hypothetical protein